MGTMEGLRGNRHADSQDIVEQRGIAEKLQGTCDLFAVAVLQLMSYTLTHLVMATHFWFQASRWNLSSSPRVFDLFGESYRAFGLKTRMSARIQRCYP